MRSLATLIACGMVFCGQGALGAETKAVGKFLTFGDAPTFTSDGNCNFAVSDDKRAFDLACNAIEASVDGGKLPDSATQRSKTKSKASAPIATASYSFVLPVANGQSVKIPFVLSGFVLTTKGAKALLLFRANGADTLVAFPEGTDREFVKTINYRAKGVSEVRVTVFVLAERPSTDAASAAFINVNKIDVETAPQKPNS